MSKIRRFASHSALALAEAGLIALLIVGLVAGTALAARGGGGGKVSYTGTISLAVPLVHDANGNDAPDRGDVVTFDVSTNASAPFVNLVCTQGGVVVLNGSHGYFDGALDTSRNFGLSSGAWQGGAADCTAYLQVQTKRGWARFASTSFRAGG
jgi:hypothetical protein